MPSLLDLRLKPSRFGVGSSLAALFAAGALLLALACGGGGGGTAAASSNPGGGPTPSSNSPSFHDLTGVSAPVSGEVVALLSNTTTSKVFMTAGDYDFSTSTYLYDVASGTITPGPDTSSPHAYASSVQMDNQHLLIFSGAGYSNGSTDNVTNVDEITLNADDTVTDQALAPLLTGRMYASATWYNGQAYIVGGQANDYTTLSSVEVYNPAGGGSSTLFPATLPDQGTSQGSAYQDAALSNGLVYLVGGISVASTSAAPVAVSAVRILDPTAGTITSSATTLPALIQGVQQSWAPLGNGTWLFAGGLIPAISGNMASSSSFIFDPTGQSGQGSFTATGSLNTARYDAATVVLGNGGVLIAGGAPSAPPYTDLTSAEIFDPTQQTFSYASSLATGKEGVAVALPESGAYPNDAAFLPGGYASAFEDGSDTSTSDVELYY